MKSFGRYEILEELGRGGMGTVYRAKDPTIDRIVALKTISEVLLAENGRELRERFYREAHSAGRLAHPGIVPIFDVGEHEGVPFLVMELVTGQTLAEAAKTGERMTLDRVCEIGKQIAESLGYAHEQGVVHRDIKPANILLTSRQVYGSERPKITDFGMVKLTGGQATITGKVLGTPAFMAPEQFTGEPVDGRADVFALGAILYWLTTGEQPFPGETMTAVSYKVVHTEPVPPRKLNPAIPEGLDRLIIKCLAKSPADRYQTAGELAQTLADVRRGLQGPPQQTVPVSMAAVAQNVHPRVASKNAAGRFALIAVLAVLVLAIIVGASVLRGRNPVDEVAGTATVAKAAPQSAPPPSPPAPDSQEVVAIKPDAAAAPVASAVPAAPVKVSLPVGPAAVDFDPKGLDPNENAKLKVDARKIALDVDFTVEMDGKVYFQRIGAGNQTREYEGLFVPPGVHEFRVTARSGDLQKVSSIVSTEFRPKKKKTLKVEARSPGKAFLGLPPDAQLFVELD